MPSPNRGPTSRSVDLRTMVAVLDPEWRKPPDVYIYPNGRKFVEVAPPFTEDLGGAYFMTSDGTGLYTPSAWGGECFYTFSG